MKNNIRIFIAAFIAVIILTAPLFLLERSAVLIIAYIFALIGVFTLTASLCWGVNRKNGEYVVTAAFPLAAFNYLIFNLVFSIAVILLAKFTIYALAAGWFFFLHLLFAGFFFWKILAMDAGKEKIEATGQKVREKSSGWKQYCMEVSALVTVADVQIRKDVASVYDALRYSDPMSDERLSETETRISEMIRQLSGMVRSHANNSVPELCRNLINEIKIRNELCKACK